MQILIDIDKERYNEIVNHYDTFPKQMRDYGVEAIRNGTVLEPHGRLGDLDYLYKKFEANGCKDSNVYRLIKDEPTIIESNKENI